jgi:hypothetical protein
MGAGGSFSGSKADRSPPSSAEVKNVWSYTSTLPICHHGVVREGTNSPLPVIFIQDIFVLVSVWESKTYRLLLVHVNWVTPLIMAGESSVWEPGVCSNVYASDILDELFFQKDLFCLLLSVGLMTWSHSYHRKVTYGSGGGGGVIFRRAVHFRFSSVANFCNRKCVSWIRSSGCFLCGGFGSKGSTIRSSVLFIFHCDDPLRYGQWRLHHIPRHQVS